MAKAEAMYSNDPKKKLVGCVFDPSAFKKTDGSLDTDALCDEIVAWVDLQQKDYERRKAEAIAAKKAREAGEGA
jgi:hypothetical protein